MPSLKAESLALVSALIFSSSFLVEALCNFTACSSKIAALAAFAACRNCASDLAPPSAALKSNCPIARLKV